MAIIIGLTGEKGGGKGTFVELLTKTAAPLTIEKITSSALLKETLDTWAILPSRDNFQKLAVLLRDNFGPDTISLAVKRRIKQSPADIVIFDGVRWDPDVDMVKGFPKHLFVYVTAPVQLRHERTKKRQEKAGENQATFEQFMDQEHLPTEVLIPQIGQQADFTINNEGSIDDYQRQVEYFFQEKLSPLLSKE